MKISSLILSPLLPSTVGPHLYHVKSKLFFFPSKGEIYLPTCTDSLAPRALVILLQGYTVPCVPARRQVLTKAPSLPPPTSFSLPLRPLGPCCNPCFTPSARCAGKGGEEGQEGRRGHRVYTALVTGEVSIQKHTSQTLR